MPPVGSALLPLTLMSVAVAAASLPASARRGAHARTESKPPFLVTAHHDFKPTDSNQLPFGKGDVLEIIRVDDATGWAAARRPSTTTVGWIPRSFVIAADDTKPKPTPEPLPRQKSNEMPTHQASAEKPLASKPPAASKAPVPTRSASPKRVPQPLQLHTTTSFMRSEPPSPLSDADALMRFSPSTFTPSSRHAGRGSTWRAQPSGSHPFAVGLEWAMRSDEALAERGPQGVSFADPEDVLGYALSDDGSSGKHSLDRGASSDRPPHAVGRSRSRSASTHPLQSKKSGSLRAVPGLPPRLGGILEGALTSRSRAGSTSNDSQTSSISASNSSGNPSFRDFIASGSLPLAGSSRGQEVGSESGAGHARSASTTSRGRSDSASTPAQPVTLSQLIENLLREHNKQTCCEEISFCAILFTTYRTFTTPEQLFERLKLRYTSTASTDPRHGQLVLLQVVNVLRCWISQHALAQESGTFVTVVSRFLLDISSSSSSAAGVARNTLLTLQLTPPPGTEPASVTTRSGKYATVEEFVKLPPNVVAEQLCLFEQRVYRKITAVDCVLYSKVQAAPETTRIRAFSATSNRIVSLVKHTVLVESVGRRVAAIEFWIKVAQRCIALQNAASACTILAALSSADVSRLNETWKAVSGTNVQAFLLAKRYIDPQSNHRTMRAFLRDADGPCVPFIGMFLRDLIHLHESMPDTIDAAPADTKSQPLINWGKRRRMAISVWQILQHQKHQYTLAEDRTVMQVLTSELNRVADIKADEFYERSEALRRSETSSSSSK